MSSDPFSLVYTALYDMAVACEPLADMVKLGNRIRFDGDTPDPAKRDAVQDADLPELVLVPETGSVNLHGNSSSSRFVRQYAFMISTGTNKLNELLNPLEWALCCGLARWRSAITDLRWPEGSGETSFVKRVDVISATQGQSDPERNRNIRGWSAVWRCEVEMYIRTADMKLYAEGGL